MVGLRPSTTGIYGLAPWFRNVEAWRDRVTLPQHFAAHGYRTLATGKVYHGGTGGGGGEAKRTVVGIGGVATPEFQINGTAGGIGAKPERKLIPSTPMGNHPLMDWGVFPHRDEEKGDYQVASWTIQQIRSAPRDQPFFLAAGFFLPHVPCYATQQWFDLYPDDDSVLPVVKEDDRADTPRFSWYLHWELPEPRLTWVKENNQWRNLVRSYLACTSFVDAQIGRILDALAEAGLAENTIVVVWGDNGWHLGEKGITGKNTLWDRSTRVPLVFAGPGIKAGQRRTQPAELLDIYPTLVELCGLPPRTDIEGLSLVPQLNDAATRRERPAITSHNQGNHGVRSERCATSATPTAARNSTICAVTREWTNLASKPEFAETIEEHKRWLPKIDEPPALGSASRVLTYDKSTDEAVWEGKVVKRGDPIPE